MSEFNTYSAAPFSGKNFEENQGRLKDGESPCAICGRAVAYPFEHPAVVIDGGADWAKTDEEAVSDDPGNMGLWGVGPDCHRKYAAK